MIAANYRKHPDAMAVQLVLKFGACKWHTARPTTRVLRAIRSAKAALVKVTEQIVQWVKRPAPQWFRDMKRRAMKLSREMKKAQMVLVFDLVETPLNGTKEVYDWRKMAQAITLGCKKAERAPSFLSHMLDDERQERSAHAWYVICPYKFGKSKVTNRKLGQYRGD